MWNRNPLTPTPLLTTHIYTHKLSSEACSLKFIVPVGVLPSSSLLILLPSSFQATSSLFLPTPLPFVAASVSIRSDGSALCLSYSTSLPLSLVFASVCLSSLWLAALGLHANYREETILLMALIHMRLFCLDWFPLC